MNSPAAEMGGKTVEIRVRGMDCAGCARSVQQAVAGVPGVRSADVLLAAGRAVAVLDPVRPADADAIRRAIVSVGYEVDDPHGEHAHAKSATELRRRVLGLLGLVASVVLVVVIAGELFGILDLVTDRVPWYIGAVIVLLMGYPVFRKVVLAAVKGRVISHSLMTVGAAAALTAGAWPTAAVVVLFMRIGNYVEHFTTDRSSAPIRSRGMSW